MNGIILINKEKGCTSRDVVNEICKIYNTRKVGHTGTLDPMAEGLLIVTLGKCTKLNDYLSSKYKEYIAEFELGYETDTLDSTGNIIKEKYQNFDKNEIENAIYSFKGKYNQEVPKYSAVKVNGKKLYEYARNNETIKLPSKIVEIKEIEILEISNKIKIKCLVSKGTYIRSLIRDIGNKLNTYATMTKLTRTKQGNFDIKNSVKISEIKNNKDNLIPIDEVFKEYKKINVDELLLKKISNGVILDNTYNSDYVLFYYENNLISIYKKDNKKIKLFIKI